MIEYGSGGVAVITGAAGGIGLGLARAAAARGMSVMLSDVDGERLQVSAEGLGDAGATVAHRAVDVTDSAALESLAADTLSEFGRVDLVCNNAGMTVVAPIHEHTIEQWHRVIDLDLNAVFYGVHAFLPVMLEQGFGHLNATASANSWRGDPFQASYNAAKHGVVGLMESVLMDLRLIEAPVTASVLSPGPIATDIMLRALGDDDEARDEVHGLLNQGMDPDEVGRITMDGIAAGRFWIWTHTGIFNTIRTRLEHALGDGSLPPDLDWPWEDVLGAS